MIFFMSFIYEIPPPTPSTLNIRIRVRIKIQRIRNTISLVDGIRVVNLILPVILILVVVGIMELMLRVLPITFIQIEFKIYLGNVVAMVIVNIF